MKTKFKELYNANIKREGAKELLEFLENKTDFFTAPASTHFHGAIPEGLCLHSINVYKCLKEHFKGNVPNAESIAIVSLLHDLCKINCYIESTRKVQREDKSWETVACYKWNPDKIVYGHGEESVLMINSFMKLTKEENFAIRYHMGAFMQNDIRALSNVYSNYKLAFYLHVSDMKSSYYLE